MATQQATFQTQLQAHMDEIRLLQLKVDEHSRSSEQEVLEALQKVEMSTKELESHKSKRLAARSEMIGLAQTLEKAQAEGEELKQFLQYSLSPLVFEQITGLEQVLMSLENANTQLSSKRSVRIQTRANDFFSRKFRKSTRNFSTEGDALPSLGVPEGGGSVDLTEEGKSSPTSSSASVANAFRSSSSTSRTQHRPLNIGIGRGGGGTRPSNMTGQSSSIGDALQQAESLRRELERMQAGITILTQAMDRLMEVVRVDTRCCGVFTDICRDLFAGSSSSNYESLQESAGSSPLPHEHKQKGSFTVLGVDDDE